jgi:hypothetical protein
LFWRNGAIIRYGDFQRNEEIIRWRKMEMFEIKWRDNHKTKRWGCFRKIEK